MNMSLVENQIESPAYTENLKEKLDFQTKSYTGWGRNN